MQESILKQNANYFERVNKHHEHIEFKEEDLIWVISDFHLEFMKA